MASDHYFLIAGAFEPVFYCAKLCKYKQKYSFVTCLRQENALAFYEGQDLHLSHEIGDSIDETQFRLYPTLHLHNPCDFGLEFYGVEDSLTSTCLANFTT